MEDNAKKATSKKGKTSIDEKEDVKASKKTTKTRKSSKKESDTEASNKTKEEATLESKEDDTIDTVNSEDNEKSLEDTKENEIKESPKKNIQDYDFEKSKKFSASNIRFLTGIAHEYCKNSNLQLHYELKHQDIKFKLKETKIITLGEFIESTEYDSVLIDYSIGRAENALFRINKKCALSFIESMLGGDGLIHNEDREITEIDTTIIEYLHISLMDKVLSVFQDENKKTSVNDVYTNTAQFKVSTDLNDDYFLAVIEVLLRNETNGEIGICIPLFKMDQFIAELNQTRESILDNKNIVDFDPGYEETIIERLHENEVTFDVVAELGKTVLTIGEISSLTEDDVIVLNSKKINEDIDILVGDAYSYKAEPCVHGLNKAVIISECVGVKGEDKNEQ